ncbi:MAG: hypothetical protein GHCLOJNM_04457 [bacterium]|nr:hypothetical protein [bacterium]
MSFPPSGRFPRKPIPRNRPSLFPNLLVVLLPLLLSFQGDVRGFAQEAPTALAKPVLLFASTPDPESAAELLNPEQIRQARGEGVAALDIMESTDPYQQSEWRFRFKEGFLKDWDRLVLAIDHADEGAGVIRPLLPRDNHPSGEWSEPTRRVSFTRLNTHQLRRALFEFEVPALEWVAPGLTHLRISGLQGLVSIWAYPQLPEAEWKEAEDSVPIQVEPLVRLERPMEITCTVGIEDIGNPPSLANSLANVREYVPLARLLGFTSVECFVRWDMLEPREREFDFSHYDQIVEAIRARGLRWFPNLVITSGYSLPSWYYESAENTGLVCLEHGQANDVPSIWNTANRRHVSRVLEAFGKRYEGKGILEAVRLGPSGNFGEAQFPAGAGSVLGYQGRKMHAHIGWWAGDPLARESFGRFLARRYGSIERLGEAWGEPFASFEEIAPRLPETYRTKRARLDMTAWYTDSMSEWCAFWAEEARKALPNTRIYQSSGGWGFRESGTDFSSQAESMKKVSGGIRLTNETDSFEQNIYATRLAATAARLYDIALGSEPAGYHSARGTVARFYNAITANVDNLYTRHGVLFSDPLSIRNWLRDYPLLDLRADPLVEVAIYYPETSNQLDDSGFRHLYAWGFNARAAEIRRRVDIDFLDERLIRAGFLDRYKVLVFCWGNILEADVLETLNRWIHAGGTVICPSYPRGAYETVDGEATFFRSWARGDTGSGAFYRFKGDMEPISLYGDFVKQVLLDDPRLSRWTQTALRIGHPERVHLSVLENGRLVMLNYRDQEAQIEFPWNESETLPAYSIQMKQLR